MNEAKQDNDKLVETAAAADPAKAKVTTSTQMEAFAFVGSPKGVADVTAFDKHSQKRVRQLSVEEAPGGARN